MRESYSLIILPFIILIFCIISLGLTIYNKYILKNNGNVITSFLYISTKIQLIVIATFMFSSILNILSFFSIKPNRYAVLAILAILLISFIYFFKVKDGLTFLVIKTAVLAILLSFIVVFYFKYNSNIIVLVLSVVLILIYSATLLKSVIDEVNSLWLHLIALLWIYVFAIACIGLIFGMFYITNNTLFVTLDSTGKNLLIFGVFRFIEFNKESVTTQELVSIWQIGLYHFYQFTNISITSLDYRVCVPFIEYIIGTIFNIGIIGFFMSYTSSKAYENSCKKKIDIKMPINENNQLNAEFLEVIKAKLDEHYEILNSLKDLSKNNSDILKYNTINPSAIYSILSNEINKLKECEVLEIISKVKGKILKRNKSHEYWEKLNKLILEIYNKQKLFFNDTTKLRGDLEILIGYIGEIKNVDKEFLIRFEKINSLVNETKKMNANLINISAQTRLISLNASIEANHVGNLGNGFRIVAQEMKKLAENSNEIVSNANNLLSNIGNELELARNLKNSMINDIQIDENINQLNIFIGGISEVAATSSVIENIIDEINEIISKEK